MKKIGLYGGTFNPVHFGHLNLALELMERGGLDEVWWMPTSCSPFREPPAGATGAQRFKMVELATETIPQFHVLDFEVKSEPPAYTVETLEVLSAQHPDKKFFLLMGADALLHFMKWKQPERILELAQPLVGGREGAQWPDFPPEIEAIFQRGWHQTPLFEISATMVRERLKKRVYCGHLLPAKVLDFIYVNQLYFTV